MRFCLILKWLLFYLLLFFYFVWYGIINAWCCIVVRECNTMYSFIWDFKLKIALVAAIAYADKLFLRMLP
jgi:hypothetical protein